MANKYIIHNATYNGDGTSPDPATSNGGVGAWNSITYFEGATPAYGSLYAGDVVYIRSKSAAGADITRTQTAITYLGSAGATPSNWITWVLDDGTIWPGIAGELKYSTTTYRLEVRSYNHVIAKNKYALSQTCTTADTGNTRLLDLKEPSRLDGILLNWSSITTGHGPHLGLANNCHLRDFKVRSVFYHAGLIQLSQYAYVTVVNPEIELLSTTETDPIFRGEGGVYGARMDVVGGRVYGAGAGESTCLYDFNAGTAAYLNIVSMDYPKTMPTARGLPSVVFGGGITAVGLDSGAGAVHVQRWGTASSRTDGNFPTLNAFLPDSQSTPWSWWIYPNGATEGAPAQLSTMRMYIEDAAQKTIALECLISSDFGALTKRQVWIDVSYIDADTGARMSVSSWQPTGVLETSEADWTSSSYGPVALNKRKMTVQTPTAVKKDTPITVMFSNSARATTSAHIMFICPDVIVV